MEAIQRLINKITYWEAWPFELLYAPISIFWVYYTIKAGAVWFFTSSNPKLTFGGMEGEPKKEMYKLLPGALYPNTFYVLPTDDFSAVQQKLVDYKIGYPLIAKPEVGGQGILLRKIDDENALMHYHKIMPWEYIVQSLVSLPMEVSVFYIRHPKQNTGIVTGFLHKIPLHVTGDGKHTLAELIDKHPKGIRTAAALFNKHQERWNDLLEMDEIYMLSYAANHNRGAKFIDLKEHIDEKLVGVFDKISLGINDFFYGRYDVMCTNIEDLKNGKNFTILEYNGCGAEPNHFYDTGYSLGGAYKEIIKHWKALYEISQYNSEQGIKPWPFNKGRKFLSYTRQHIRNMKNIDLKMG